jgi:hypothetical protein
MPNGQTLELADLPTMHPLCGDWFLHAFGPPAVFRLTIDPIRQPSGTMSRRVDVDWVTQPGCDLAVHLQRSISWANLKQAIPNLGTLLIQCPIGTNAQDLTEQAAIGVMALLIHDLEGVALRTVLQIGSGGDYVVQFQEGQAVTQVEVSGIRHAETASISEARLAQKREQVLKHSRTGYASVTTFSYPGGPIVHSYLHYVRQPPRKKGRAKRKKP